MGDRYFSYYPCPECGETVEEYNAPSCGMLVAICDKCGWKADNPYLEEDDEARLLDIENV